MDSGHGSDSSSNINGFENACHANNYSSSSSSPINSVPGIPVSNINSWLIPTTEVTLRTLKKYLLSYRQYVAKNPIWISEVESALYWVSYLLSCNFF